MMSESPSGSAPGPEDQPSDRRDLLARLERALASGAVSDDDVERLLAPRRRAGTDTPTAPALLAALGAVVVFVGCALAYSTIYSDMPQNAQITTPFVFPIVAWTACVLLGRTRRGWEAEIAGIIGFVSYGVA
jgi:hypothetical protein